ncbi:MAG: tRNA lysidine(34) synthetase TilS [Flavobacteriaceae bacterium]|nr:tRNA lysidine(34) synthetase TilS [Flavobacteriaceae bacterium]
MLTQFSEHINIHFSFLKDKKLLIAISGGLDSVALTHLFNQLNFSISLAHCNFRLRGKDADQDEVFVKQLAEQLQVPVFTRSFETEIVAKQKKLSIQLTARKLRYDWFDELTKKHKLDYLLTAHHADDNLETFLINTIRGTGLDGLTGIPEKNKNIIRPLLLFSREQIENYAKENNIAWQEDSTNAETKYLRNKIRHEVIPILKELNPSLLTSFGQTIENLKGSRQIIDDRITRVKKTAVIPAPDGYREGIQKLSIENLKKLNNPKAYLYELLKNCGFTEWNDITNLLEAQSGKQALSKTHRLVKDRDYLLLSDLLPTKTEEKAYRIKKKDEDLEIEDFKLKLSSVKTRNLKPETQNTTYVDKDKLKFPLNVRKWKNGDYFYPFGMQGKKKLSKFFKDEKISLLQKEKIWLLCSENQIVWIIGRRLDDRYKIKDTTKNILKIEIIK